MELKRNYTPGPWRVVPNTHHSDDTNPDSLIIQDDGATGAGIAWAKPANASLIAAAPDLVEALAPFSHPDLWKILSGNANGVDSIVFQRDKAILTIGDFVRAAAALRKAGVLA